MIATVDISKDTLSGYFRMCNGGPASKVFMVKNSFQGLTDYYTRVMAFAEKHTAKEIVVGYESTGVYHVPFVQFWKDKAVHLVQVNTMHVKRMKDITDNSPAKTDKKDPRVIADLIEMRHALQVVVPTGPMAEMRTLIHARERVLKQFTAVNSQLQDVVYVLFPEFSSVIKDLSGKTAKHLLSRYPTPQAILMLGIEELTFLMRKTSRGRLGKDKADLLYRAAQNSLGVSEGIENLCLEIGMLLEYIGHLEHTLAIYKQRLENLITQVPQGKYLLSIKGIGPIIIAGILGEYDGFRPFTTIAEVLKYAGMNFTENSSGNRQGKRRMTKRGRNLVRKLSYYAALNTVKKGRDFHDIYQKHLQKGMEKNKALMAVARKIIRILFTMSKNLCYFEREHQSSYKIAA
jgi:transposase